ncbi:hypothetical protein [Actinoplanes sp. GCM10030250]|uniref:hypothetical protein n=1 Tax=Actinoplanes sp. GCM10030250 TaxID=3273376 RepID=UPI0036104C05
MRWIMGRFRHWRLSAELGDWLPVMAILVGYGLIRIAVTAAVVYRGGWPTEALGWSGAAGSLAAAGQAAAVALLLPAVRRRRPALAWTIAIFGVGIALIDAVLWVVLGSAAAPGGYAWQLVLATALAVAALVLCRTGMRWMSSGSGYDLRRVERVLVRTGGVSIVLAASGGISAVLVEQPVWADWLLRLLAVVGAAAAVSAVIAVLALVLERVRRQRGARVADMYRQISDAAEPADR